MPAQLLQAATAAIVTVVVLGLVVLVHEVGHFVAARLVGIRVLEFGIGFPPRARTLGRRGDTEYTLNWLPIGGFVKFEGEESDSADPAAFSNASLPRQLVALVAGVAMNVAVALFLFFLAIWLFNPAAGFRTTHVTPGSAAATAGLTAGDTIETVNGERYGLIGTGASTALRDRAGERVTLGIVDAAGRSRTVHVTIADRAAIDRGTSALGVDLQAVSLGGVITTDPLRAVPDAIAETGNTFGRIVGALERLAGGLMHNPTHAPSDVSGPVGVGREVGFALWDYGPALLVFLAANLSASLALMNVLPFPPLDGGRMLVLAVKRLFRQRGVSWLEATTYLVGFALLMVFIMWISFFDITSPAVR